MLLAILDAHWIGKWFIVSLNIWSHLKGHLKWSNLNCAAALSAYKCSIFVWRCQLYCEMFFFVSEQILHNIKQEYKRLQKRRHLDSAFQQADGCCPLDLPNIHTGSALPGSYKRYILMRILILIYQSPVWAERVKSNVNIVYHYLEQRCATMSHRIVVYITIISQISSPNHYFIVIIWCSFI